MAKVPLMPYVGGLPIRWTDAKSASFTPSAKEDSGTLFLIAGATAAVVMTLPKIADGPFYFEVINCSDQDLTITAGTVDTIITFNDLAADSVAFSTSSEKIGGSARIICDGTRLVVLPSLATEAQTVTVAT